MSFQKIGLGGVLSFDSRQAEAAMSRVGKSFGFLNGSAKSHSSAVGQVSGSYTDASGKLINARGQFMATGSATADSTVKMGKLSGAIRSVSSMGTGLTNALSGMGKGLLAMGAMTAPLAMGVKGMTDQYFDFNKQMSAVQAVGLMNEEQFQRMREESIRLGSATKFTATEAAEGMENLTRAGFSVEESLGAASSVLALAASDNMDLGTAADITANIIRSMGLSAEKDSQRVADVLALTSAKTNTDVISLGEAFKMSASTASMFHMSIEETAAVLGKLADSGLRGTLGGTSFTNMMVKLAKPSKKAAALMEQYNIKLTDSEGKTRKMFDITKDVGLALAGIPDEAERAAVGFELTGIRGIKALNGLMQAGDGLPALEAQLVNAGENGGAAARMSAIQMQNMRGQLTILDSAIEGFTIRFFDLFDGLDGSSIAPLVDAMGRLNTAWDAIKTAMKDGLTSKEQSKLEQEHGVTMVALILGLRDGVKALQDIVKAVTKKFSEWSQAADGAVGKDTIRQIVKIAVVVGGIAIALSPVLLGFGALALLITNVVIPVISGIAAVASAAFLPALLAVAALSIAFGILKKDGESVGDFMSRMWDSVKSAALDVWENGIKPLWEGIKEGWATVWPMLQVVASQVLDSIMGLVDSLCALWEGLTGDVVAGETDWKSFGETAVKWLGDVATSIMRVVGFVVDLAASLISILTPVIVAVVDMLKSVWTNALSPLWEGIKQGWEQVWPTLKVVALEVLDAIMVLAQTLVDLWYDLTGAVGESSFSWQEAGRIAVQVISAVIIVIAKIIKWLIQAITWVVKFIGDIIRVVVAFIKVGFGFITRIVGIVIDFFGGLVDAFKMLAGGDVLGALKTAGMAIINFVLSPIRLVVGALADFIDTLLNMRAVKNLLPDSTLAGMRDFVGGMRDFADKGITLSDMPKGESGAPKDPSGINPMGLANKSRKGADKRKDASLFDSMDGMNGLGAFGSDQLSQLQSGFVTYEAQQAAEKDKETKGLTAEQTEAITAAIEDAACDPNPTVNSTVNIDGKTVAKNQAKHQQDLADRLGAKTPPFVRRIAAEQGTIPPR